MATYFLQDMCASQQKIVQGKDWQFANISILADQIKQHFRLRIKVTVGGYSSDAAIGDVKISKDICGDGGYALIRHNTKQSICI